MSVAGQETTVSVIIPAYNAERYVSRAIESCLKQTHPPLEILVVDDGSTDNTVTIVNRFTAPVRLICKPNGGPASARNRGAAEAAGDWIALLDADDWWFPAKLERQVAFTGAPGVGLVHCLPDHREERPPSVLSFDDLWKRNWIINSSVLIRRTAFEALGGFEEAKELISVEDYNLWLRVAASTWSIVTCPEVLVHYTRGIGISSDSDRFMAASLCNVDALEVRLGLPSNLTRAKRTSILAQFGQLAIHERRMDHARRLLWQSFWLEPTVRSAAYFIVALAPPGLLNVKRHAVRQLQMTNGDAEWEELGWAETGPHSSGARVPATPNTGSILDRREHNLAGTERIDGPILITTVDAEESFDWTRPFERGAINVAGMRQQYRAHEFFTRYGVVPVYLVDYPVATQDGGKAPLLELLADGRCEIGTQLHPWVTPPFVEHLSVHNSYPGNLPAALEREKLQTLTRALEDAFHVAPCLYRAGRYGAGAHTAGFLKELGYRADTSVMPRWSFTSDGGPDYRDMTAEPFWIDPERTLLEIPISAALVGSAAGLRRSFPSKLFDGIAKRTHLPAVMARLNLLERLKLTPEGITIGEAKRLVRHMKANGHKVFVLTYHSPSLEPGNTPYVRTAEDLRRFLDWLDEFFDFFIGEIGGRCASWREVYASLR